jgi:glucose-1-phosphate thymidylyltransferase
VKGVILAGGRGTRLNPLTRVINKHLLPVGQLPMILHSVNKLKEAGITQICIVTGKSSAGQFAELLGSGEDWGVSLHYRIQDDAGGIAQALGLVEDFIRPGETFAVLLGDNLFEDGLEPYLQAFDGTSGGASVLLKEVEDPKRYGVPFMQDGRISYIEEKPQDPKSSYCVTGIYLYGESVFDIIRTIHPSRRGELEITDVNNAYALQGQLSYHILSGWWIDAGTFQSLALANRLLASGKEEASAGSGEEEQEKPLEEDSSKEEAEG